VPYPHAKLVVSYSGYGGHRAFEISTTSPRYRMASGVGVGSTLQQLRKVMNVGCDHPVRYCAYPRSGSVVASFAIDASTGRVAEIAIEGP
jgi:hypothetical protein